MENRSHALMAGIFILLLGAATAWAIWWFSGEREQMADYQLVLTGSISGLNPQAQVRFRGMQAGKVMQLRIDPDDPRNILVNIRIRADLPITHGTRASLGYQGVTGLAFIDLDDRGTDLRPLRSEDGKPPRIALEAGLIDRLSETVVDALERFKEVSGQVGGFFDDENLARFRATLDRLESAVAGIDQTFSEAPKALASIGAFFSKENQANWAALMANLEKMSAEAVPVVTQAGQLLQQLESTLADLGAAAGATTDGLLDESLPQLNSLLTELNDTAIKMGRLIEEVEAAPQMLITGRGTRQPGPGEHGFVSPTAP